jgi:DNA modification methylase
MAPEIALQGLEDLPKDALVLDPMSGSGMVLGTAAKRGLNSVGYDLDPLACMISRANGTSVNPDKVRNLCEQLLELCRQFPPEETYLPWVDDDAETKTYIDFWFANMQQEQLRALSFFLVSEPFISSRSYLDVLKIAVSRLIVTKEPKASLARDTAHSRPHRTIVENNFDVFSALPKSVEHVLSALKPREIQKKAKAYKGDARRMGRIRDYSIDCIVTSPPYLNAIDYMRGHRLSLVWLGYSVSSLRAIRSRSVGAERVEDCTDCEELNVFFSSLHESVGDKKRRMLRRYYKDLCDMTEEAHRVLKSRKTANYVIGNSHVNGHEIRNSELLISAAKRSGFEVIDRYERKIPENRRYMPCNASAGSSLSKRMRSEHVLMLRKVS